jgi:hypothetical protein
MLCGVVPHNSRTSCRCYARISISDPYSQPPQNSDFEYSIRQMSASTVSAAEVDSSITSRPEKRPPSSSPETHRPRPSLSTEHPSWDFDSDAKIVETGLDDSKVQLPPTSTLWNEVLLRASGWSPALPSESHLSAPYPPTNPGRYGDYLGTAISGSRRTSFSSCYVSSPNFASPLIADIKSQGESGTPRLPPNRIADFTLHQLRLGMTGILLTRIMPTPRITRH